MKFNDHWNMQSIKGTLVLVAALTAIATVKYIVGY